MSVTKLVLTLALIATVSTRVPKTLKFLETAEPQVIAPFQGMNEAVDFVKGFLEGSIIEEQTNILTCADPDAEFIRSAARIIELFKNFDYKGDIAKWLVNLTEELKTFAAAIDERLQVCAEIKGKCLDFINRLEKLRENPRYWKTVLTNLAATIMDFNEQYASVKDSYEKNDFKAIGHVLGDDVHQVFYSNL